MRLVGCSQLISGLVRASSRSDAPCEGLKGVLVQPGSNLLADSQNAPTLIAARWRGAALAWGSLLDRGSQLCARNLSVKSGRDGIAGNFVLALPWQCCIPVCLWAYTGHDVRDVVLVECDRTVRVVVSVSAPMSILLALFDLPHRLCGASPTIAGGRHRSW